MLFFPSILLMFHPASFVIFQNPMKKGRFSSTNQCRISSMNSIKKVLYVQMPDLGGGFKFQTPYLLYIHNYTHISCYIYISSICTESQFFSSTFHKKNSTCFTPLPPHLDPTPSPHNNAWALAFRGVVCCLQHLPTKLFDC